MDERQRAQLQDLLEQRERELEAEIGRLRASIAAPASESFTEVRDPSEDGDARMMASVDLVQLQRQEAALRSIRAARDRMRQGSYGECEECGATIPFARLQLRPDARFCVPHEEAWEKEHARRAAPVQS